MLDIRNITKTFHAGTPNEVRALRDVALTIQDHEFVIVIGTNVTRWPEHKRARFIGRVFQNPFSGTAPNMSIAENLALAARRGLPRGLGWALPGNFRKG